MIRIKSGRETITVSKQDDCLAIIHREHNIHTNETETTPIFLKPETFADLIRPMIDVAKDFRKETK
jgi:hypothetical protein